MDKQGKHSWILEFRSSTNCLAQKVPCSYCNTRDPETKVQEASLFKAGAMTAVIHSRPALSSHRFLQYAPMANECYILMLIYLDRISQTNSAFCITALNAHRLIVTGLVLVCVSSPPLAPTPTPSLRFVGLHC